MKKYHVKYAIYFDYKISYMYRYLKVYKKSILLYRLEPFKNQSKIAYFFRNLEKNCNIAPILYR